MRSENVKVSGIPSHHLAHRYSWIRPASTSLRATCVPQGLPVGDFGFDGLLDPEPVLAGREGELVSQLQEHGEHNKSAEVVGTLEDGIP